MAKKIRYAVVGLGHFAQVAILPAFERTRRAELVALFSDDPDKLKKLKRKYKVEHALGYDAYDELLASGAVDAVYIALPNSLHREYTERAATAGVHVLCEKPMAPTVADCEAMIAACEASSVKLMIAYRLHFERANLSAVELAQGGKLGDLRYFSSTFSYQVQEGNIRTRKDVAGGPLLDIGVYCINAARYLFRDEPIEVTAFGASANDPRFREVDEQVSAILRFPRERLAQFTVSFGAADASAYEIVGTEGSLRMDPAYEYVGELQYSLKVKGKAGKKTFGKRDQIAPEIDAFSECILEDRVPEPSGVEGLADVRVVEAIQRSAQIGSAVALGGFEKRRRPTLEQEERRPAHDEPPTVNVEAPTRE
jgi:predicted dehydrogenase